MGYDERALEACAYDQHLRPKCLTSFTVNFWIPIFANFFLFCTVSGQDFGLFFVVSRKYVGARRFRFESKYSA